MQESMNTETVAALVGFLALAGGQLATLLTLIIRMDRQRNEINQRIDTLSKDINQRFEDVNQRFDKAAEDVNQRFDKAADAVDKRFDAVDKRFDAVDKRFDETIREIAEQRERMARLEGSLDGFLAGRRDRDAA